MIIDNRARGNIMDGNGHVRCIALCTNTSNIRSSYPRFRYVLANSCAAFCGLCTTRKCSIFSEFVFSACIKLSGNQRAYLYSGGSGLSIDIHFVDIELSYAVLSPLPIVLSKHFNHPHPYIEIATAISDTVHSI